MNKETLFVACTGLLVLGFTSYNCQRCYIGVLCPIQKTCPVNLFWQIIIILTKEFLCYQLQYLWGDQNRYLHPQLLQKEEWFLCWSEWLIWCKEEFVCTALTTEKQLTHCPSLHSIFVNCICTWYSLTVIMTWRPLLRVLIKLILLLNCFRLFYMNPPFVINVILPYSVL